MTVSTTDVPMTERLAVAAIVHEERGQADPIIVNMVAHLRDAGHRVLGIMQEPVTMVPGECIPDMILIDLDGGERYNITQDLGKCSVGCSLDASVVTDASVVLRRALAQKPDLIVVNRFGKLEMMGSGFYAEIIAIIEAGIPMITAVSADHYAAWEEFTGGTATTLSPKQEDVNAWCHHYLAAKETQRS